MSTSAIQTRRIEYPESDGQPMAETDLHIQLMFDWRFALREFFNQTKDVYVGTNLMFYYVEGDPTKSVAPDVFVVRGVGNHDRRIYKLWEEGQAPQVVIEVSSRKTKNEDLTWKKQLYAWLGVAEYFIFDPEYKLKPALRAFRLRGKELIEEVVIGNRVASNELGLE
ncbi:MAG: Uma2 family endonuclease, partial [Blastocatellia bacterium]